MNCLFHKTAQQITWSVIVSVSLYTGGSVVAAESTGPKVAPFVTAYFKQYCYRCHSNKVQKGDRRLETYR